MPSGGDLEFRVLGPVEVRLGDRSLALGGAKQRALVADLALQAGRIVSAQQLIDDLWGEEPPRSADHTLEAYVSRIRRALRDGDLGGLILTRPPGYVLQVDPDRVDALRFDRLVAEGEAAQHRGEPQEASRLLGSAVGMWRGPALADVAEAPFAQGAAQRLESRRLLALEQRIDAELSLGRERNLVGELESLTKAHPYRERFHAQLILALYRSHRQADALAAYRRTRELLVEELGIEPGVELQRLEQAVLRQDPELDPGPATPVRVVSDASSSVVLATRPAPVQETPPSAHPPLLAEIRPDPLGRSRRRRRRRTTVAVLVVVVASVAIAVPLALRAHGPPTTVPANGLGVLAADGKAIDLGFALPAPPGNLVLGEEALWVTSPEAHEVYRIDPTTGEITQTISVGGGAGGVAVGAGDVWVANAIDGTVSRIDVATNQLVQTIPVGTDPTGVGYGEGSVWVANSTSGSLSRIDPWSGTVLQTIGLGVQPFDVAVGQRSVWVTSQSSNSLLRLDPISGDVTQRIGVGGGPTRVVVGFGSIWVANSRDSTVSQIDPERGAVAATIPVGDGPSGLAIGAGGVWAANALAGTVVRVDPTAGRVVSSLTLGNRPGSLAVVEGRVWVGVRAAGQLGHRGGTLRVVTSYPFASLDPAVAWPEPPHQLMGYTYDTLVTFQPVGGTEGLQVVPDLAVALPEPTDGGRTYTFVLRPGLRYSNGSAVAPEDFRRALERAYELNSAVAASFSPLVGANTCSGSPQECDLSEGITVNDHSRTVSFHLADPDPDFLYKLASYFTAPIPARGADGEPIPGTGPYMIERFVPGHEAVFVRNPAFREWSRAAQPDGFPDRIEWTFGLSIEDMTSAVAAGRAEWMSDPVDAETAARFPGQVHVNQHLGTHWAFFNTTVPPFDDVRVRRALNFAVDRAAVASLIGAPEAGRPTCQLLPPTISGYRPYCPYTVNPSPSGTWLGPDLPRARRLIEESHTQGMPVTYLAHEDLIEIATGRYVVSLLRDLGYKAKMRVVSDAEFGSLVDSPGKAQIGAQTWFADYPSPSNFFGPFLSCSTVAGREQVNISKFCHPEIDSLVHEAATTAFSDPARAANLWAQAEQEVTDLAPLLPLVNLNSVEFVSARVGNYQFNPVWGVVLDQLWVN